MQEKKKVQRTVIFQIPKINYMIVNQTKNLQKDVNQKNQSPQF